MEKFYSVQEVAKQLRCHPSTVYSLIAAHKRTIEHVKIGDRNYGITMKGLEQLRVLGAPVAPPVKKEAPSKLQLKNATAQMAHVESLSAALIDLDRRLKKVGELLQAKITKLTDELTTPDSSDPNIPF